MRGEGGELAGLDGRLPALLDERGLRCRQMVCAGLEQPREVVGHVDPAHVIAAVGAVVVRQREDRLVTVEPGAQRALDDARPLGGLPCAVVEHVFDS